MTTLSFQLRSLICATALIMPSLHRHERTTVRGETFVEAYSSRHRFKSFVAPTTTNKNNQKPKHSSYSPTRHSPNPHHPQLQRQSQTQRKMTTSTDDTTETTATKKEEGDGESKAEKPPNRRSIVVSGEIDLPVPATVAFDAWADLPRQPIWSPWLHKVSYISSSDDNNANGNSVMNKLNSKWTMSYLGLKFSWTSVTTALDRPKRIAWESTSGTKNYGEVFFEETAPEQTRMRLTLTFIAPRVLTKLFGERSALARVVDRRLTQQTLQNFRQVVMEDYAEIRRQNEGRKEEFDKSSSEKHSTDAGPIKVSRWRSIFRGRERGR